MAQQTTELSSVLKDKIADLAKGNRLYLFNPARLRLLYALSGMWSSHPMPRCGYSPTYHKHGVTTQCHYCDYQSPVPDRCPNCHSDYLRTLGLGTQKIEELLNYTFQRLELFVWIWILTRKKGQHEAPS